MRHDSTDHVAVALASVMNRLKNLKPQLPYTEWDNALGHMQEALTILQKLSRYRPPITDEESDAFVAEIAAYHDRGTRS